ncbi:MAG: PaaI family thioesterase [Desulfopila sp.]
MKSENIKRYFANDRFAAMSGIDILEVGPGYCKAAMRVADQHKNAADNVQGGAIFTLADLAFAVASNSHGQMAVAINANIAFLKAVREGVLFATASEVTEPGRLGSYDVLITDETEAVVARFTGMVYRKRQQLMTRPAPGDDQA